MQEKGSIVSIVDGTMPSKQIYLYCRGCFQFYEWRVGISYTYLNHLLLLKHRTIHVVNQSKGTIISQSCDLNLAREKIKGIKVKHVKVKWGYLS
jgi:hypothetical protein